MFKWASWAAFEENRMTWFKSLIMCQNSPLLLIDSDRSEESASSERLDLENNSSINNNNNSLALSRRLNRQGRQAQVRSKRRNNISSSSPLVHLENNCRLFEDCQDETGQVTLQLDTQRLPHLVQTATATATTTTKMTTSRQPVNNKNNHLFSASFNEQLKQEQYDISTSQLANTSQEAADRVKGKSNLISKVVKQTSKSRRRKMELKIRREENLFLTCLSSLLFITVMVCFVAGQQQQYFEVQPEHQYLVHNGHDVRLRCLIRNRQGECLWLRNGRAIGIIPKKYQFIRQPEDGDCSLMIRNVSVQQDDGLWQCQVTASDVEQDTLQSREVHLVVLVPPERPQIKNMVSFPQAPHALRGWINEWGAMTTRVIDWPLVVVAPEAFFFHNTNNNNITSTWIENLSKPANWIM